MFYFWGHSSGALADENHNHNYTFVPKKIKWYDVLKKDDWHFDSITEQNIKEENQHFDQVIRFPDESTDLKFIRS